MELFERFFPVNEWQGLQGKCNYLHNRFMDKPPAPVPAPGAGDVKGV